MRARGWVFTQNNPTDEDAISITCLPYQYLVIGIEAGSKTNTPHYQGYIYFSHARTRESILNMFPFKYLAAQEARSNKLAADYCKKGGEYYEFGELPQQGRRSDSHAVVQMAKDGASFEEIIENHPSVFRCKRHVEALLEMYRPKVETCNLEIYTREQPIYEYLETIEYKNAKFIIDLDELATYDSKIHDLVILESSMYDTRLIDRLARSIPITVKYGYEYKEVMPEHLIIVDPHFRYKDCSFIDYINIIC